MERTVPDQRTSHAGITFQGLPFCLSASCPTERVLCGQMGPRIQRGPTVPICHPGIGLRSPAARGNCGPGLKKVVMAMMALKPPLRASLSMPPSVGTHHARDWAQSSVPFLIVTATLPSWGYPLLAIPKSKSSLLPPQKYFFPSSLFCWQNLFVV